MHRRLTSDQGISLVEMVVAVLVLSIGVVAGFKSMGQAQRGIGEELPRLYAQQVAVNRVEELQIRGASAVDALPDEVKMGGINWQVSVDAAPTDGGYLELRVGVRADKNPGAIVVGYAPAGPPK